MVKGEFISKLLIGINYDYFDHVTGRLFFLTLYQTKKMDWVKLKALADDKMNAA